MSLKPAAAQLLNSLRAAISAPPPAQAIAAATPPPAPPAVAPAQVRWFLDGLEIEGFRGINNEGAPLTLKFKPDSVHSISATNGVGKSSIYDAMCFALRGEIPKLERLLQAERPQDYYLNRFHSGSVGTIKLTLRPDNGAGNVAITITRNNRGVRTVTGPSGFNAEGLLAELNREFVLIDGDTFRSFIDEKALDRGRAFSGLLGLSRYSDLRQSLQGLSNTRAFNTHFGTEAITEELRALLGSIAKRATTVLTSSEKKPWTGDGFGSSWWKTREDAGLGDSGLRFHDFRGTAATRFFLAGLSLREIAEILGWSEDRVEKIINRYVKRDEILKDRIRRIEHHSREQARLRDNGA